ncbi:MAG: cysteine--1-D-myo-inosityl 2-amino-2-deoxy-alpha-D-glucopyranoside ligase [Geodermatophilaceae bacterium]|jgi:L-cysteine:1D-myo-inositol 2-amino-2-deoxy-alpha-D-glucopyranoside ligase
MQSWPGPPIPKLPGRGLPLRLFDSATSQIRPTSPGATAGMYVCGITPYDATHLGHAATYLAFDLVNRVWRDGGHDVHLVQNVTDIDDPLLERAERDHEDWMVLGMRETALFREDMTALRIVPPTDYVGAVESIDETVALIVALLDDGAAYRLEDGTGDVYYDVARSERFGYESGLSGEAMLGFFAERGGDPDRGGKRNRLDPHLWRGARAGEPSWASAVGPGRPGWHIECTAIALNRLGMAFDVQGGGSDLMFPHHEMSAAHAESVTGRWPFARHYVHAGMIGLHGAKMSKSRGNLVFVSRLRGEKVDPMAIRTALLAGHYREDRPWTPSLLDQAQARLARWREAVSLGVGPDAGPLLDSVRRQLADDLDTVNALSTVDRWAAEALQRSGRDTGASQLVSDTVDALLGIAL